MNRKFLAGMLGVLLLAGLGRAQGFADTNSDTATPRDEGAEKVVPHFLSDWITFANKGFVPPPDMNLHPAPPIGTELFVRAGPSAPFGSGTYATVLSPGWMIEGGARALFFNPSLDAAWVIEASISNTNNVANSSSPNNPITLNIIQNGVRGNQVVTVHDLNQTFLNFGGGRDWYLWHPEGSNRSLSFGIDAGGRWGTAKADFNEIPHRTGMLYGAYAAIHADLLCPVGGCFTFVCGVRGEYDLMQNSNILQNTITLQDVSLLLNVGLKF